MTGISCTSDLTCNIKCNNMETNYSSGSSWIPVDRDSDFPIQNLPLGVGIVDQSKTVVLSRIGDTVINLAVLFEEGLLDGLGFDSSDFRANSLNQFMRHGKGGTQRLRNRLLALFSESNEELQSNMPLREKVLSQAEDVKMLLPVEIGDYTDFYSSKEHATNVGKMFRDPENALLPNWLHIPVGYHGRSSSVVVSDVPVHRPKGQTKPVENEPPVFGPTKQLDFELEMAFITYDGKSLGDSIATDEAEDFIFGLVLLNDWSARDIQKWEYVPLGPFLAKNFASSMSPWVLTLEALEPFRVDGPEQTPEVLPYLSFTGKKSFDIGLEVSIQPENKEESCICRSNFKYLYWNMAQQLAHHTVNGCNIRRGDVLGSGTISGPDEGSYGSMLELAWKGTKPIVLKDGTQRVFIEDGDTVIMRGSCHKSGYHIGFGELRTKVLPAK